MSLGWERVNQSQPNLQGKAELSKGGGWRVDPSFRSTLYERKTLIIACTAFWGQSSNTYMFCLSSTPLCSRLTTNMIRRCFVEAAPASLDSTHSTALSHSSCSASTYRQRRERHVSLSSMAACACVCVCVDSQRVVLIQREEGGREGGRERERERERGRHDTTMCMSTALIGVHVFYMFALRWNGMTFMVFLCVW